MAALARWKVLCMDATDPDRLDEFWTAVLRQDSVAMCRVPEPKTVKHRAHIDVFAASVEEIVALGATVLVPEGRDPWTVLADPEGGEFCVMVRPPGELPDDRFYELIVDAAVPERVGRWWADVFDVPSHVTEDDDWALDGVPGAGFDILFQPVPEPKAVKNRIHWDVYGDAAELIAAGATLLWAGPEWTVLADPEGNEFCVFEPR